MQEEPPLAGARGSVQNTVAARITRAAGKGVMGSSAPLAYFITFSCYGTRLHGDEEDSVDRAHNTPGAPRLPPRRGWVMGEERNMKQPAYRLNRMEREIALRAVQQHCGYRNWRLRAAHVRSTHIHFVVEAEAIPETILTEVKAYASRALNRAGKETLNRVRWSRHGSTRYLWKPEHVRAAMQYVIHGQGDSMAVWQNEEPVYNMGS
jgi:REP element-mobilizing transposase RayT